MRKIAEIRNDLNAKIAEVKAIDRENVEAMEAATRELEALVAELNAANEVEAAEQRAAENKFNQMQKNAGRSFSLLKFIREIAAGNLSGLEAEVAEMGSEEYRRLGLSQSGTVLPMHRTSSSLPPTASEPSTRRCPAHRPATPSATCRRVTPGR